MIDCTVIWIDGLMEEWDEEGLLREYHNCRNLVEICKKSLEIINKVNYDVAHRTRLFGNMGTESIDFCAGDVL